MNFKDYLTSNINESLKTDNKNAMVVFNKFEDLDYQLLVKEGIVPESMRFKGTNKTVDKIIIHKEIVLSDSKYSVVIQSNERNYQIFGDRKKLSKMFTRKIGKIGGGSTPAKEETTMNIIRLYIQNKDTSEEEHLKFVDQHERLYKYYENSYYKRSIQLLEKIKGIIPSGMIFEIPSSKHMKAMFEQASSFGSGGNIWNPADIMLIKKSTASDFLKKVKGTENITELNLLIHTFVQSKNLWPISLKNQSGKPSFQLIDPKISNTIEGIDLAFSKVTGGGENFSNFWIWNKGKFAIKLYQQTSSKSLNVTIMGAGPGVGVGSITSRDDWKEFLRRNKKYPIYRKSTVGGLYNKMPDVVDEKTFNEARKHYIKYKDVLNNPYDKTKYEDLSPWHRQRYIGLATHFGFIMDNYNEAMPFIYGTSTKKAVTDKDSVSAHWLLK